MARGIEERASVCITGGRVAVGSLYKVLFGLMDVVHNFGDVPAYAIVIEVLHPSLVQHSHKSAGPHGH
jgi:hypothetical protein